MNIKRIFLIVITFITVAALAGCKSDENPAETVTGNIDMPSFNTSQLVSAPDSSTQSGTESSDIIESSSEESWGEATASEGVNTSNYTEFTANSENAPDLSNISIDVSPGFISTSDTQLTIGVHNRTGWEIVFTPRYVLKKIVGTDLEDVPFVDNPYFGDKAYLLGTGKDSFVIIDLTQLQTSLEQGAYMVGLDMACNGYPGDFYIYTTFHVK